VFRFVEFFSVLDLNSFIVHHMPDESHKDETCKAHITLVQLLNFILYHLCNFPVFVSMLNLKYVLNYLLFGDIPRSTSKGHFDPCDFLW